MSRGYLNARDWRYFGGFLGNKASGINVKYASDPYWGEKAAAVAWNLDRSLVLDQEKYTIGIKTPLMGTSPYTSVNIRSESNTGSAVLYESGMQMDSAVLILDKNPQNGFYSIQSDSVLNSGRTGINTSTGKYDFKQMYAYISSDYVDIVSIGKGKFRDVQPGSWYYNSVMEIYEKGIMVGLNDYQFGPAENLARAQFAVILHRMSGSPKVPYQGVFPDVGDGIWYTNAVMWARNTGIISGYSDTGYFGPSDQITREQMAVMMYHYAESLNFDTNEKADYSSFIDAGSVSSFASEAMQWAVATGMITGKNDGTMIDPQGFANRAECAAIILRFIKKYNL